MLLFCMNCSDEIHNALFIFLSCLGSVSVFQVAAERNLARAMDFFRANSPHVLPTTSSTTASSRAARAAPPLDPNGALAPKPIDVVPDRNGLPHVAIAPVLSSSVAANETRDAARRAIAEMEQAYKYKRSEVYGLSCFLKKITFSSSTVRVGGA